MQDAQLNLKLHKDLFQEIELLSKVFRVPKVEWVRSVLSQEVRKEVEKEKTAIARAYLKGSITKKELALLLGKEDATDIETIERVGRDSRKYAEILAKSMK